MVELAATVMPEMVLKHAQDGGFAMPREGGALPEETRTLMLLGIALATGSHCVEGLMHKAKVLEIDNAKILACSCFASGLRIIDIHNPASPREMAYYKPPAQGTKVLPGSQYANLNSAPPGTTYSRPYDYTTAKVSFPKDRGETTGDIWITSQDNGFQVIKLYSAISVSPKTLATGHDQTESFKATVSGAAATGGAVWTIQEGATGGTIDPDGTYHSPAAGGTYHLVATALLDPSKTDTATVTVYGAKGGCSSAEASLSAVAALGLLLALRRRRTHA